MRFAALVPLTAAFLAAAALADEQPVALKEAAGHDVVEANCGSCHSLDYIVMNSPFMSAEVWRSEVTKMIKTYGAPVSEEDAAVIAAYLTENYGVAAADSTPRPAQQRR